MSGGAAARGGRPAAPPPRRRYGYLPPSLRRLKIRPGPPPRIAVPQPSLQLEQWAPAELRARLLALVGGLAGVSVEPSPPPAPGDALLLSEDLAGGQPEAFLGKRAFAVLRADGSLHLRLAPGWGQKVLDRGWATIHPLARYMAGAVAPGSLIVYAPRDAGDLLSVARIARAAHAFAAGRVDGRPLPGSRW